jgi:WD40 repeat protein
MTLDCGTGIVTCHRLRKDIENRVELLIGFASSDTVVYTTVIKDTQTADSKMVRFNAGKAVDTKPISSVAWLDNRFIVAHESGYLYVYNRNFTEQVVIPNEKETITSEYKYSVTHNKKANSNPISKIFLMDEICRDLQVSNDRTRIATATANGYIHILDSITFQLLKVFKSSFGGLLSIDWSPDDKYIVSGGEDDCITIYSVDDDCVIVRGIKGHLAFISSVRFDPFLKQSDKYRVVSVGQDGFLSIWDLDKLNLKEPELIETLQKQKKTIEGITFIPSQQVPEIEPDSTQHIHTQPIGDVCVFKDGYITFCQENYIRFWLRPGHEFKIIKKDKIPDKIPETTADGKEK